MVRRQREDFRTHLKGVLRKPYCGESADEFFARTNRNEAMKNGLSIPTTVFVRRKDGVVKELPVFYDDMMFTYDGARIERVLNGVDWTRVRSHVRLFAFDGINKALEKDATTLSLCPGEFREADYDVDFGDEDEADTPVASRLGWLDEVRQKVCVVTGRSSQLT